MTRHRGNFGRFRAKQANAGGMPTSDLVEIDSSREGWLILTKLGQFCRMLALATCRTQGSAGQDLCRRVPAELMTGDLRREIRAVYSPVPREGHDPHLLPGVLELIPPVGPRLVSACDRRELSAQTFGVAFSCVAVSLVNSSSSLARWIRLGPKTTNLDPTSAHFVRLRPNVV